MSEREKAVATDEEIAAKTKRAKEAARTQELMQAPFWVLPSGMTVRPDQIAAISPMDQPWQAPIPGMRRALILSLTNREQPVTIHDEHDCAAMMSAVLRIGAEIESATLAGDDADGDGVTQEAEKKYLG